MAEAVHYALSREYPVSGHQVGKLAFQAQRTAPALNRTGPVMGRSPYLQLDWRRLTLGQMADKG